MNSVQTEERWFAIFYSPGTFVSETSERPLETNSAAEAFRVAQTIKERHGAIPFGFDIVKRLVTVATKDVPSVALKELECSGRHYIDGRILTLEDVKREMPGESILIGNMEGNGIDRVVTGPVRGKGWRWTHQFKAGDKLLDSDGAHLDAGSSKP